MTKALKDMSQTRALTIKNTIPEISRMNHWLTVSLADFGLSNSVQFRFDLCANEAVTNIISYAYPAKDIHEIGLLLTLKSDTVILNIEDDGIAFNPFLMAEHSAPKSLSEAKIGGLGIDLIRHYVDDFNYMRRDDRNILSLKIKLDE